MRLKPTLRHVAGVRFLLEVPMRSQTLGVFVALAVAWTGATQAATFTVLNTNDSGPGSLRQAISDANGSPGADTITFAPSAVGTILLSNVLPAVFEDLDIAGPGSAAVTVNGQHMGPIFDFRLGVTATISGMTIADGSNPPAGGAAIFNRGQLTIRNCTLSGNSAPSYGGGAIYNFGTLAISDSVLSGNSAIFGGAILNETLGTLTIEDTALTGNHVSFEGGGIENFGVLTINNGTFSGNSADLTGGAILNGAALGGPGGRLTINDSTLSGNSAGAPNAGGGGGGGLGNGGTATINRSTLSGNTAIGDGGGIYSVGTLVISNSTLSSNSASGGGGGIQNSLIAAFGGVGATISFSTLTNNTAASGGGLLNKLSNSSVIVKNSIVASNGGGDCANPGGGTFMALGTNQATDSSCPGFTQLTPGQLNLAPLASNGGPTQTHALLPGSAAIDAATDCTDAAGNPVIEDQRGEVRPLDGAPTGGLACDVGAYEFAPNGVPDVPMLDRRGLALLVLLVAAAAVLVMRRAQPPALRRSRRPGF